MNEGQRARRPGGRSARVAAEVHQAVTDLISERGYGNFTVGEVAARAGVADSSIYRRWGNLENLLSDVALTRLNARSPMPDTGSLDGDLRTYAANVAREITGPDGLAVVRLAVALSGNGQQGLQAGDDL
ncbi:TetR family transcriptional regulator, partial [Streptomyces sp. SID7760]|nr:TetR family transcriptional regulator [Streptomyces sp. SID7760]